MRGIYKQDMWRQEVGGAGRVRWEEHGGIMNGERKNPEGHSAHNWRQKYLCGAEIGKGLQDTTVTGVVGNL
jgi:hypothetical protein